MEGSDILLTLRKRALQHLGNGFKPTSMMHRIIHNLETYLHPDQELVVPFPQTLNQHLQSSTVSSPCFQQPERILNPTQLLSCDQMIEIIDTLITIDAKSVLTPLEQQCYSSLISQVLTTMLHYSQNAWEDLRSFLLEMVVNTKINGQKLAFKLIFNLSVIVNMEPIRDTTEHQDLFTLFIEMLDKLVALERISCIDCNVWDIVITCLLYYVASDNIFSVERILQVDPYALAALLDYIDNKFDPVIEYQILELAIFAMYLQQLEETNTADDTKMKTIISTLGSTIRKPHSSISTQWQLPTSYALNPTFLTYCGGIEALVQRMLNTTSLQVQRLIFMVLHDVTIYQLCFDSSRNGFSVTDFTHTLELLNDLDFPFYYISYPYIGFKSVLPRLVNRLWKVNTNSCRMQNVSKSHLTELLVEMQNQIKTHEHFSESQALKNSFSILTQQNRGHEAIMDRITQLLDSTSKADNKKAERWLAELLAYRDKNNNSSQPNDCDLEETLVIDEDNELRALARGKFWELGKSLLMKHRMSFLHILRYFIRRSVQFTEKASLVPKVGSCLMVLVHEEEKNPNVLAYSLTILLELCVMPHSYFHEQRMDIESNSTEPVFSSKKLHSSNSILACILSGSAALDASLLPSMPWRYLVHIVRQITACVHPSNKCIGSRCGVISASVGDALACAAFIVSKSSENQGHLSIESFISMLNCCDGRVAIFGASMLNSYIKKSTTNESYHRELLQLLKTNKQNHQSKLIYDPVLKSHAFLNKVEIQ